MLCDAAANDHCTAVLLYVAVGTPNCAACADLSLQHALSDAVKGLRLSAESYIVAVSCQIKPTSSWQIAQCVMQPSILHGMQRIIWRSMSLQKLAVTTLCTLLDPIGITSDWNVWTYFHTRPLVFTFHLTYTDNTVHYFLITAQADLTRHKATQQHLNGRRSEGAV